MSDRESSPADRPDLFHRGSDGGTETEMGSLALYRNNKPPVLPHIILS